MNTAPSTPPRLRCRLVRLGISIRGETALFARHVASCVDCQRVLRAGEEWESALRRDARQARSEPPIGLERRIMHAVSASPRPEAPFRPPLFVLGAAAIAAVILAVVFRDSPPSRDSGRESVVASATQAAATINALKTFSNRLLDAVDTPAPALAVSSNPLRQEMDSVYSDARFALGFLALNFLPSRGDVPVYASRSDG